MSKEEFKDLMMYLYKSYRNDPDTAETAIFYDALGIYTKDQVAQSMREWVQASVYFPRVADLIRLIRDQEITFQAVLNELQRIISIPVGSSWNRKEIHPASFQILNELGGKMSIGQMSTKDLEKNVRMKYGYVVTEKLIGHRTEEKARIGKRMNKTIHIGDALDIS